MAPPRRFGLHAREGRGSFAPGETRRAVTIGVADDKVPELDESLTLGVRRRRQGHRNDRRRRPRRKAATRSEIRAPQRPVLRLRPRRTCAGISVGATYGSAGTGRWTFESRDGNRRLMLAKIDGEAARRRPGADGVPVPARQASAALRRRVLAQRNPILYAMLSFTAESGKPANVRCAFACDGETSQAAGAATLRGLRWSARGRRAVRFGPRRPFRRRP